MKLSKRLSCLWERRELLQWVPGRSPGRKWFQCFQASNIASRWGVCRKLRSCYRRRLLTDKPCIWSSRDSPPRGSARGPYVRSLLHGVVMLHIRLNSTPFHHVYVALQHAADALCLKLLFQFHTWLQRFSFNFEHTWDTRISYRYRQGRI